MYRISLVDVPFEGHREHHGPLSCGQLYIWQEVHRHAPRNWPLLNIRASVTIGKERSVHSVQDALRTILERHEALRTLLHADRDAEPVQVVLKHGTLALSLYEVTHGDWREAAPRILDSLAAHRFDHAGELPLRAGLVLENGRPRALLLAVNHLAVDAYGRLALETELERLLTRDGDAARLGPRPLQPVDQQEREATPAQRDNSRRALEHWRTRLRKAPQTPFPALEASKRPPSFRYYVMSSKTVTAALEKISARHRVVSSAALLSAVATALSVEAGTDLLLVEFTVGNRFHPDTLALVGSTSQNVPILLDTSVERFSGLLSNSYREILQAFRHGTFEPPEARSLTRRLDHERGTRIQLPIRYNDMRETGDATFQGAGTATPPGDSRPGATVRFLGTDDWDAGPSVHVMVESSGGETWITLCVDTSVLPDRRAEPVLLGIERILVSAADADMDMLDAKAATAIEPMVRKPGWVLVDACWIELTAVGDLIAQATDGALGRVFCDIGLGGGERATLTACIAADGRPLSPHDVHTRCVALLPDRPAAMAPHEYVIFDRAPKDPGELSSWHEGNVVAAGPGR